MVAASTSLTQTKRRRFHAAIIAQRTALCQRDRLERCSKDRPATPFTLVLLLSK
jgi:hypothetical protein